jgi:ABC-type transport system substrate-binding protein
MGAVSDPLKYFEYIKFVIVPDVSARAMGLLSGDFQMAELSPEVVDQVTGSANCTVLPDIEAVLATDVIRLGGLNKLDKYGHAPVDPVARYDSDRPWSNPTVIGTKTAGQLVRQALNLAIDKTALVNSVYEGVGKPAAASMSIPEWVTTLTPYGYDKAQAEALLDQAGYPEVDGVRFSITLIADERYTDKLVALAVQSYWQEVGIAVTVQDMLWSALRPAWQKGGNTEGNLATGDTNYAWMHRTPPSTGDPALAINMAFDPGATLGDYTEEAEDALRLAMLTEIDPAQRTAKLKALGAYVNAQATQIFLVSVYGPIGVSTTLAEPRDVFDLKENPELIHRA